MSVRVFPLPAPADDKQRTRRRRHRRQLLAVHYSVRYEAVNAMLLREFFKEHRTVQEQQKQIDALRAELKEQRALIQKVNDKVELDRFAPQTVLNSPR